MKYKELSNLLSHGRIIIIEQRYVFGGDTFCAFFENYQQIDTLDDYLTGGDCEWGDKQFGVCNADWFPYTQGATPVEALDKLVDYINKWRSTDEWLYRVQMVYAYLDKTNSHNFDPFSKWDKIDDREFDKMFSYETWVNKLKERGSNV